MRLTRQRGPIVSCTHCGRLPQFRERFCRTLCVYGAKGLKSRTSSSTEGLRRVRKAIDVRQDCSFADTRSRNTFCGRFGVIDMRLTGRAESKGVCISLLRNEAVLCDIRKAGHRITTAGQYIKFFSTEFRRFDPCCCRCSSGAACNR